MIRKFARSISVAAQVAVLGFEKSYKLGETIDSILGYTDTLTDVANRKAFERDRKSADDTYSLVLIDVDNFKGINDTKGHPYGDTVLRRLAAILQECVGPDGRVYRIGGDEFACIVPVVDVSSICNAIRNNVRKQDSFTVSQGIACVQPNGITSSSLRMADTAMYTAKSQGKDCVAAIAPSMA